MQFIQCLSYWALCPFLVMIFKGPSTLATLWPRIVAGIFIPVGNHYFPALASTLQFVAQVCDRLWLVPATDRAFACITYMSPPHVALVCSGPPQCAATCGWTKWPVCSGPKTFLLILTLIQCIISFDLFLRWWSLFVIHLFSLGLLLREQLANSSLKCYDKKCRFSHSQ